MPGNCKSRYLQHKNYNMNILEYFIALVAPHRCLRCNAEGTLLCYQCQQQIAVPATVCVRCGKTTAAGRTCRSCRIPFVASVICATHFTEAARQLVHDIKFGRRRAAAVPMAAMMARACDTALAEQPDIVVYIPTATSRARSRGYDQAERIARELARQLNIPLVPLLYRRGQQRQVGQHRTARLRQMQTAFWLRQPHRATGRHILIVDDVLTTGATVQAAATVLTTAGARRVSAALFAATQKQSGAPHASLL
jgi:ComF family protein